MIHFDRLIEIGVGNFWSLVSSLMTVNRLPRLHNIGCCPSGDRMCCYGSNKLLALLQLVDFSNLSGNKRNDVVYV